MGQKDGGIEFFDSQCALKDRTEGPLLHHYRSSNHKIEESYLQTCWNECLEKKLCIPSHVVWTEDKHGKFTKEASSFLSDEGIVISYEVVDIAVSTTSVNLLIPGDLQEEEEEDEDVIMFSLVPDDECILHPKADDTHKESLEVEADVCTSWEPDLIDQESQPISEVQKDYLMTGKHFILTEKKIIFEVTPLPAHLSHK